jgi:chromosome segregation ATPase
MVNGGGMDMRVFRITWCCVVCGLLCSGNAFGAPPDPMDRSLNQFSQGLQHLVESSNNLVQSNDVLSADNKVLKQREQSLSQQSIFFDKDNARLEQELSGYKEKTKDKVEINKQHETKLIEYKALLGKLDQEIALKKISWVERQKQQTFVLKLLEITNNGGTVEQNIQAIKETQTQMSRQVNEGGKRIKGLENEWKELSFWYGSPAVSVPQLTATRNELKEQLAGLKNSGISEKWEQDQAQIQKLEMGVQNLIKQHSSYTKELQVIESKNDEEEKTPKSWADEKKLLQNLNQLKRDNKSLQRQAADLRRDLVEWDKKKSALETIVTVNK